MISWVIYLAFGVISVGIWLMPPQQTRLERYLWEHPMWAGAFVLFWFPIWVCSLVGVALYILGWLAIGFARWVLWVDGADDEVVEERSSAS